MTQAQYNEAINLIGHLILTAGDSLTQLLHSYGVGFSSPPSRSQLIDATIDLLGVDNSQFTAALAVLVERHIDTQGDALLALRKAGFDSYIDEEEDAFFGGLIKGAIGALGGLLKKKKKSGKSSSSSSSSDALKYQQALQAKQDLERQIQRMHNEQRQKDEQHSKELQQAKKRTQNILIAGGVGVLVLGILAVVLLKSKSPSAPMYHPPKSQAYVPTP